MAEWYYSNQGRQLGPVTREELRRLGAQGILQPTDMIWKQGMPEWVPASSAKGLIPERTPSAQPLADDSRTTLEAMPIADDEPARTTMESMPPASGVRAATLSPDLNRTMLGETPSANPKHAVSADAQEPRRGPRPPAPRGRQRPRSDADLPPIKQGSSKKLWLGIIGGVAILLIGGGVALMLMLRQGDSRSFSMHHGESSDFQVEFEKGKWIEVTVEPESEGELDLYVFDKDDNRIAFDAKQGSDCVVQFFPDKTQTYRLEVRSKGFFGEDAVTGKLKWKIRDASELSEIADKAPKKIEEELTLNDRDEAANRRRKEYLFHLDKGKSYTLEMFSRFDSMIKVLDLSNQVLAQIEDNSQGRSARLFFAPENTGVVKVIATSIHGHSTGPFILNVRPKTAADDTSRSFLLHPFDTVRFDQTFKKSALMEVALENAPPNMKLRVLDSGNRVIPTIDSTDDKVLFMPSQTQPYRIEISSPNNIGGGNKGVLATVGWRTQTIDGLAKSARKAPETIDAKLAHNDPSIGPGKYHKTYLFHFDANQTYTIEMLSAFENYVAIHDLSDKAHVSANGTPSTGNRVFFKPVKSGVFKVLAGTSRNHTTGDFKLAVRPKTAADDVTRAFHLPSGRTSRFDVSLIKGTLVEVAIKENLGKMQLRILDEANKEIESLDASSTQPKVLIVPPASKSYHVEVANQNRFGMPAVYGTIQWQIRPYSDISKLARPTPAKIDASLERTDRRPSGKYYKSYLVSLEEKQAYTFDVFGAFDNYVQVNDLSGRVLATSSLSTNTANSRMFFTPNASGVYQVVAGPISGSRTGKMTVNIRKKTAEDDKKKPFLLTRYQYARFSVPLIKGQQVQFVVTTNNTNKVQIRVRGSGSRFRTLGYADTVNGIARLTVTPNPGDTSLQVEVSNRNISDAAPAAGYIAWQGGAAVANVPDPKRPGFNNRPKVILTKADFLRRGGLTYQRTKFAKVYNVPMKANKKYTIRMTSVFDNYLVLQSLKGQTLSVDDDSFGRNAQIIYRPIVSGVYRVIATTFSGGQQGSFSLSVTEE